MKLNKKILLIAIGILVLVAAIVICLFVVNSNKAEDPYPVVYPGIYQYTSLMKATSCEQLHQLAEEAGINLLLFSEDILAIGGVWLDDQEINVIFEHNADAIEMVRWSYDICTAEDIDVNDETAMTYFKDSIADISRYLGVVLETTVDAVLLYSPEGYAVDADDNENYRKMLTGEIIFDIAIQDQEGMIWSARTDFSEEGVLSVNFFRSLNKEFNNSRTPDIILEETEGETQYESIP